MAILSAFTGYFHADSDHVSSNLEKQVATLPGHTIHRDCNGPGLPPCELHDQGLSPDDNVKVDGVTYPREVIIQPHTDEGGDAYYIGDAYEPICGEHEEADGEGWAIKLDNRPYLKFVKRISECLPHLEYLGHWMQVGAAPPKWKFLKKYPQHRAERARRTHVSVIDYDHEGHLERYPEYNTCEALQKFLNDHPQSDSTAHSRLIIVEDLSRDVVELLGSRYDIDPLFFLSHISDYLFHNTRDRWVELPDLDVIARQRCHFNIQYLRPRYFKTPEEFSEAEYATGLFNVLRRLDSDRSSKRLQNTLLDRPGASVTLTRAKTSIWCKPRGASNTVEEPILVILLVDPTVKQGYPLWGGYRPFEDTPSMDKVDTFNPPNSTTLFENIIHWCCKLTSDDLALVRRDSRCLALPMYQIVLAEWRTVLKYMTTMLGKIEWEFENPHWGERPSDIDASLRKLSPWRRNVPYYQAMISEAMNRLFPPGTQTEFGIASVTTPLPRNGVSSLLFDFRLVQQQMDACQSRIERILGMANNSINIEESRRAVQQNNNLARLTFLATTFIPLSFTTSFLSMSPDFTTATQTIWLFFVIGIPLTIVALLVVDLSHPQEGYVKRKWRSFKTPAPKPEAVTTVPWIKTQMTNRFGNFKTS